MSHSGATPPSGVKLSCIALTEPLDAAVVAVAHRALCVIPKRVSLPSMLPPAASALAWASTPSAVRRGLPACSAASVANTSGTKITTIAAKIAHPCRRSLTTAPNEKQSAAGINKIASS